MATKHTPHDDTTGQIDTRLLLQTLTAVKNGDFSVSPPRRVDRHQRQDRQNVQRGRRAETDTHPRD